MSLPNNIDAIRHGTIGSESPRPSNVTTDNASQAASGGTLVQKVGKNGEIEVSSGAGGTSINIGNGATQFNISPSGHLTLKSSSSSGITLSATNGQIFIDAPTVSIQSSGALHLGGKSVSIASDGDVSISAPQGDLHIIGQKMTQEINGQYTITASKDFGLIVGGNMRQTIAGSTRIGSTGLIEVDTGSYMKIRANGELDLNSGEALQLYSNKTMQVHSKSGMSLSADSFIRLNSEGSSIIASAKQNIGLNAQGQMFIYSKGAADINAQDTLNVTAQGLLKLSSKGAGIDIASDLNTRISGGEGIKIFGGNEIDIDSGGEIHMQMNHATKVSPETPKPPTGTIIAQAPDPAQIEAAETIISTISSNIEASDIPTNLGGSGGGGGTATGSSVGRTTNGGATGSGYSGPSGPASRDGVDKKLMDVYDCAVSKFQQQTGYTVRMISGLRPGDPRFHGKGMALDVDIDNPCGQTLGNYQNEVDDQAFAVYEVFAHQMKQCQEQLYPGMPFRWGGYFWNGGRGNYGAMDPMHFDIGGNTTGGGSWGGGATPQQLNEWGLSSSSSKGYSGQPDYSRVPDCGGQKKSGGGSDKWAKADKVEETAKNANKSNYEKK